MGGVGREPRSISKSIRIILSIKQPTKRQTNQRITQSASQEIKELTSPSIKHIISQPMGKHGLECWGSCVAGTLWVYCYWKQPFSTTATWNTPRSRVQQCLKYLPSLYGYLFSIESSRNRVQTVPVKLFFFFLLFKISLVKHLVKIPRVTTTTETERERLFEILRPKQTEQTLYTHTLTLHLNKKKR